MIFSCFFFVLFCFFVFGAVFPISLFGCSAFTFKAVPLFCWKSCSVSQHLLMSTWICRALRLLLIVPQFSHPMGLVHKSPWYYRAWTHIQGGMCFVASCKHHGEILEMEKAGTVVQFVHICLQTSQCCFFHEFRHSIWPHTPWSNKFHNWPVLEIRHNFPSSIPPSSGCGVIPCWDLCSKALFLHTGVLLLLFLFYLRFATAVLNQ